MNEFSSLFHRLGALMLMFIVGVGVTDALLNGGDRDAPAVMNVQELHSDPFSMNPNTESTWTLVAGGDVMLSRYVQSVIDRTSVDYPFDGIREIIQSADIAFMNLENPVLNGPRIGEDGLIFRANPESLNGVRDAGFDIVSLANNHQSDMGQAYIGTTIENVKNADIIPVGSGQDRAQARAPAVFDMNGTRVTFLAYGDKRFVSQVHFATANKPGINPAEPDIMREDIRNAKSQSDIVVVSIHAGTEYAENPDSIQEQLAEVAAEAGADIVLGHHPHVVQPLKKIGNTWVAYSLGNLVFDQLWSEQTQRGMMLKFIFRGKELIDIEPIPIAIQNKVQPQVATGSVAESILKRLQVKLFTMKDGRTIVAPEAPKAPTDVPEI